MDVAVLNAGAARVAVAGPSPLTFTAADAVTLARAWPKAVIVPLHFEGWTHFSEGAAELRRPSLERDSPHACAGPHREFPPSFPDRSPGACTAQERLAYSLAATTEHPHLSNRRRRGAHPWRSVHEPVHPPSMRKP